MNSWSSRIFLCISLVMAGIVMSIGGFLTWIRRYPSDEDPKNIDYVRWTYGLNQNMNLDHALAGMSRDAGAVKFVKGLSEDQIRSRFGYVFSFDQTTPYLRGCPKANATKNVIYLRDSPWMVILENGRAVDLVLCKGY